MLCFKIHLLCSWAPTRPPTALANPNNNWAERVSSRHVFSRQRKRGPRVTICRLSFVLMSFCYLGCCFRTCTMGDPQSATGARRQTAVYKRGESVQRGALDSALESAAMRPGSGLTYREGWVPEHSTPPTPNGGEQPRLLLTPKLRQAGEGGA